jgi:hypothetical protein
MKEVAQDEGEENCAEQAEHDSNGEDENRATGAARRGRV